MNSCVREHILVCPQLQYVVCLYLKVIMILKKQSVDCQLLLSGVIFVAATLLFTLYSFTFPP